MSPVPVAEVAEAETDQWVRGTVRWANICLPSSSPACAALSPGLTTNSLFAVWDSPFKNKSLTKVFLSIPYSLDCAGLNRHFLPSSDIILQFFIHMLLLSFPSPEKRRNAGGFCTVEDSVLTVDSDSDFYSGPTAVNN